MHACNHARKPIGLAFGNLDVDHALTRGAHALHTGIDLRKRKLTCLSQRVLKGAQRVVGNVDAQDLALERELHVTIPLLAIGLGDLNLKAGALHIAKHVKKRRLTRCAVLLALGCRVDDVLGVVLVHERHELTARIAR